MMTKEQFEEKLLLSKMVSHKDFDYKNALMKMIYDYKYNILDDNINDISYQEIDNEISIRIGTCFVKQMNDNKTEEANYRRLYETFVKFLIDNTVKL